MAVSLSQTVVRIGQIAEATAVVEDRSLLFSVGGEIDLSNARELTRRFMGAVADARPRHVTLDLDALTFIDGPGRRALRRIEEMLATASIGCELILPSRHAARLSLELAGFQLPSRRGREG